MAPIGTAIIGLSPDAATSWAANAHLPYLLSPEGRAKYRIVALLNSSAASAQRAIAAYGLDAETRAYGDPEALAADPDVELVVCATRVDLHYPTVLPSVRTGKDVFVEWPLADNVEHAAELTTLAREKGGRTAIGLQGRFAPAVLKLRDELASGRIGKVLSSEVRAFGGIKDRATVPTGLKYFTDRAVGGNPFTIAFGHMFDFVQFVLGDVHTSQSSLQLQRPDVRVKDPSSGDIIETVRSNVPDLVFFAGLLPASEQVAPNASLHIRVRTGQPFKGEAPMVWAINGEKGEIRLTAADGPSLQVSGKENAPVIEFHDFQTDTVQPIEYDSNLRLDIKLPARNIGAVYEAFAAGDETKYPTFEHATKRHSQLRDILENFHEV